jgi:hypothetical protein
MKLRSVTLKAPSLALKTYRFNADEYDLQWGDSFILAVPLNGKGPSVVWPIQNVAEAILANESLEEPREKPALAIVPKNPPKKAGK